MRRKVNDKCSLFDAFVLIKNGNAITTCCSCLGGTYVDFESVSPGSPQNHVSVLQENPDLWQWISGQEQPPESISTNPVSLILSFK